MHDVAVPDRAGELGGEAALLLGTCGCARQLGQPALLQQPMHRRARQALARHDPGGFEQARLHEGQFPGGFERECAVDKIRRRREPAETPLQVAGGEQGVGAGMR